jgi:hypothetical protein
MTTPLNNPTASEATWAWWQNVLFFIASPILLPAAIAVVLLICLAMPVLMLLEFATVVLYPESHPGFLYSGDDPAEWERREAFQAYRSRVGLFRRVLELVHVVPYDAPPGWHRRGFLYLPSPCPR